MAKGIAIVAHKVSPDPVYCEYDGADDGFGEKSVCRYLCTRDRTHGRYAPVEKRVPKCTLFDSWLEKPGVYCVRCIECKRACGEIEDDLHAK
jgi:hypothetical protein